MIYVTIYQNNHEEITGFRTKGHAGYAQAGQDIVCAAVSVLIINTINAIDAFTSDYISVSSEESKGEIELHLKVRPSDETKLLLNTMVLGLKQMVDDENYAEYIDLTFEEV